MVKPCHHIVSPLAVFNITRRIRMNKSLFITAFSIIVLTGCTNHPISTFQPFQTKDLNPLVNSGYLQPKIDTFIALVDSSSSTSDIYWGEGFPGQSEPTKFSVERELLIRMNRAIPDIPLYAGLRSFGFGPCQHWDKAYLNQPIQNYVQVDYLSAIRSMECSGGGTTIVSAFQAVDTDIQASTGNVAVILFSDGTSYDKTLSPLIASLKSKYNEKFCLSTVWVGNHYEESGQQALQNLSELTQCGTSINAAEMARTKGMASFVQKVFFNTVSPIQPEVTVDLDTDRDGVPDKDDKCPDTPLGAKVDKDGCWSFTGILFDFDQFQIKPESASMFDNSIKVLKLNPAMTVELQGHTDNIGSVKYNQGLSERRAKAVKNHLTNNGIAEKRLSTRGFSELQPVATNQTAEGRAKNRRVVYQRTDK